MNREFLEELLMQFRGLYRDTDKGLFYGVCAGLADRFAWPLCTVRLVAVLCLIVFFLPTVVLYLAAALLLPPKPLTFHGAREGDFWRSRGRRGSRRWCT